MLLKCKRKVEEEEIEKMDEGKEDEESYASEFANSMFNDDDDSDTRIEPKVHGKVDKVLHEIIPWIVEKATDDLIEELFKNYVSKNVIEVHPTTSTSTSTKSSANIPQQLYLNMKSNLQDQAANPALWDVLNCKFEKSSTSNTSCKDDAFRPHNHDDHQEDDAPTEAEKRRKIYKTSKSLKSSKSSKSARSSSSK
nr:hypothetical protein [Tanacetum cinerariifolium]